MSIGGNVQKHTLKEAESFVAMVDRCIEALESIKSHMLERRLNLPSCKPYLPSSLNLQDYLSLKKHDLTELQEMLSILGLSSLGKSHFHLLYTINRELELLYLLKGEQRSYTDEPVGYGEAYELLCKRAAFLKSDRKQCDSFTSSVMITLPSDAARNAEFKATLADDYVDICRINTAHDSFEVWEVMASMIAELNRNSRKENPIKIYVDLAGPKFRTGPLQQTPTAFKISWRKMDSVTIVPQSSRLTTAPVPSDTPDAPDKAIIVVPDAFFRTLSSADTILLEDSEERHRQCKILSCDALMCKIRVKNILIEPETRISSMVDGEILQTSMPVNLALSDEPIRLFVGERLYLTNKLIEGHSCEGQSYKAIVSCLTDDFLPFVQINDTIYIDDGAMQFRVVEKLEAGVICEVIKAKPKGTLLKPEKGVNFPDSDITMCALTASDRENLEKVLVFADIIGMSFVQEARDVEALRHYLYEHRKEHVGIIAKIETKKAVKNLPLILLALMGHHHSGVMLARGDLAIEVGFENLSKVQEEIFDLCEAAHMPVIYATQILENLMKKNLPSRSEIIDATIAHRADCVMLNKGPFAKETVMTLRRILRATQDFLLKDKPRLHMTEEWKGFHTKITKEYAHENN